jgi:hypothetical protein
VRQFDRKKGVFLISFFFLFDVKSLVLASEHQKNDHVSVKAHAVSHENDREKMSDKEKVVQKNLPSKKSSLLEEVWESFLAKLEEMELLDKHNQVLRSQVAKLKVENSKLHELAGASEELERANELKKKATEETGVSEGRTLASIHEHSKENFENKSGSQILKMAHENFQQGNFEKAAQAYSYINLKKEFKEHQGLDSYFYSGVSFYKIKNYKRSLQALEQAESMHHKKDAFGPKILVWKILALKKLKKEKEEQNEIKKLIEEYPRSTEAKLLNSKRGISSHE